MKQKLLFVYLFFVCISGSFGQGTSQSKIPGINQAKVSQDKICNLGQEMRDGTFPKPGILKINDSQSRSNPVMQPQAKTAITSSSFPGARTATSYTSIYNGVEYSSDHPYNLNVVYFVPNDVPLDPTYQSRLSAILLAGQEFYRQNMIANGYGPKTFGMFTETANPANVKIILINGAGPLSTYADGSNNPEFSEVNAYFNSNPLQKTSEHTLIITAVPDLANATVPFYGSDRTCFALDYPGFDIQNISTGANYFTKWYGGMMHELGHGLNLPHSHQTNSENADPLKGMNLMSRGNGTLGISPTFINRAGAAILNNSQVFAEVPGGTYYNGIYAGFTDLKMYYKNGNITISGTFESVPEVTDMNIYQNPYDTPSNGYSDGYDRVAWSVSPSGNSFTVTMPVSELQNTNGPYYMVLEFVLKNGSVTQKTFPFSYNNGIPSYEGWILLPAPALCAAASPNLAIFSENFESGLGAFTTSHETPSGSWETRNWIQDGAPDGRTGKVAFGEDYQGGDCGLSDQSGIIRMESPVINIPTGITGNLNMAFYHYINSEDAYDGGNIKYAINGGTWTLLLTVAFTANGYGKLLATTDQGNSNPLQGQPAFTGTNEGTSYGSWGQSQVDLTSIGLVAGDDIQLRWEMGTDGCGGFDGWYIDDITIYSCGALPVTLVKFEGKHSAEGNQLSWTTTAEVNNEYFGVEKSLNGLKFREISRIAGSGNSSVINTYKFTDSDFQKGISYYRLKQVDTDGTYAYSRIISVDGADLQDLKFFPNPVESLLTIELPDADMKAADVKVFNSVGQQVLESRKMTAINGQLNLDLGKLPTGIYQVIMTNGNKVKSISILKL